MEKSLVRTIIIEVRRIRVKKFHTKFQKLDEAPRRDNFTLLPIYIMIDKYKNGISKNYTISKL